MKNTNGVIDDCICITFKDMTAIHCPVCMFVYIVDWFKTR